MLSYYVHYFYLTARDIASWVAELKIALYLLVTRARKLNQIINSQLYPLYSRVGKGNMGS